ncbi:splicing factor 3B subunit 3 [Trichuris trichiura]|uniref:Splicing factor 3B subunit 3 n=1 Tax=Trichuris trichiura TaxID=36087 RepID=A0A077Z2I3_TRITR|nr:splicing factor 3B subunit 3 [Trichuris trichiura]
MNLYHLTLQKPSAIYCAVGGSFSGMKQTEVVVGHGHVLEVLRVDVATGRMVTLISIEVFGIIRSLISFRLTGSSKDYIVVGSDSGRICILEYDGARNALIRVHQETFGKSGCRRVVPGQYLSVDPRGRAIMIGAPEKQKLVYIMNRDSNARLTISSPLEAHKTQSICFAMIGIDVGYENPLFACLEVDYEAKIEADLDTTGEAALKAVQTLTFYELDLGLNHVVRKYAEPLEHFGNHLIAVPGGADGPSGVLICCENYILYKNLGEQQDIQISLPRRRSDAEDPERTALVVCSASHKTKSMFFFLVQTEQGDVFKLTLETVEDIVTEMKIKYFDTLPVANSMCLLKTGFLFIAAEFGNHYLYQIARLGDEEDDEEIEFSSLMPLEEGETFYFSPRELRNLIEVHEILSLAPILSCEIADLAFEDTPQIYVACGRGPISSMKVLRHGLEVIEMAISELPGNPNAVWTVKKHVDDENDAYIVVSFVNATLVLSIGDTVEEVTDSGFLGTTSTLCCTLLGADSLVQVFPEGIRHIQGDRRVNEWKVPARRMISNCTVNRKQSGQLNEFTERKEMSCEVVSMALAEVPPGEVRCRFLAVALTDHSVRIISLDPVDCLASLYMQALPALGTSLCIAACEGEETSGSLFLNAGLENGVLLRTVLDNVTGELRDTRTRYLGTRPVKLFKVKLQEQTAVLAISSRSWLLYHFQNRYHLTPIRYLQLESASSFSSDQCPEGFVVIAANSLRILMIEKLGTVFNYTSYQLNRTPRKFVVHSESLNIMLIETDHNAFTDKMLQEKKKEMEQAIIALGQEDSTLDVELFKQLCQKELPPEKFGSPRAGSGMWASAVRIMSPVDGRTLQLIPFEQNEAALSLAIVQFASQPENHFLLVGIAINPQLRPRKVQGGCIYTFLISAAGDSLEFIHKTMVEEAVTSISSFRGRILVGVGKALRLYEFGKKKLLRKCENRHIPYMVTNILSMGSRIYVCDVQESVLFFRYKTTENQLILFADDTFQRYCTCFCLLDFDTVAVGDKFGNLAILRLPAGTVDDVQEDPTGIRALWDKGVLNGASQKCELIAFFFVGECITSLQKTTLITGSSDILIYATISGTIGALAPFSSQEDFELFTHLEMHMRSHFPPLCGRDHLSYRSFYGPVKAVVDGDLCEQFSLLENYKQKEIAEDLDRTPTEVSKKLEDIRTRYAF